MTTSLVVTASELDDYEWCPQYRYWKHKRRRRPIGPEPEWAVLGTWAHKQLEGMMQGHAPPEDLLPPIPNAAGRALRTSIHTWWNRFGLRHPWDSVLTAEVALEVDIGVLRSGRRVLLRGIPDAFVIWNGALWHCSHKTLAQSKPVETFCWGLARELHECLYPLFAPLWFPGLTYGGTMANIIRKLSEKRVNEEPESALHLEFLPIDQERIEGARLDTLEIAQRIEDELGGTRLHRRRSACTGKYGNSKCAYEGPCWSGISIDNNVLFESFDPMQRYNQTEE